ncbi:type II secretion system minor pseudopilin GspK [Trabulsiella odontotermitis]|uniref:type II secretion system minor pseudopilin GspK n=1 Tax=Trabulsiella odontotermitis TaxID=379893 RepID=UPI0006BA25D8|nr:type II secretion system minor pseudopilin GspK [Trabulsiella odontotermitis]
MKQQGMALLITLLILGLMAGLAADMATRFQTSLRRIGQEENVLQQQWDFRVAETQALSILQQDLTDNPQASTRDQYWAQSRTLHLKHDATVSWQLRSAQNCFNLNALAHPPLEALEDPPYASAVFQALLEQNGVSTLNAKILIASIADYIDSDDTLRRDGAEDSNYSDKPLRYVANQPFFDISELRAIKGMTPGLYQKLSPWLCAQGSSKLEINVNALTQDNAPLLAALLLNEQDVDSVRRFLSTAPKSGWKSVQELTAAATQAWPTHKEALTVLDKALVTSNNFFTLTSRQQRNGRMVVQRSEIYYQRKERQLRIYARYAVAGDR